MKREVNGHTVEIQDTGAPRGERNWWCVSLNGVELYNAPNGKKADELYQNLMEALQRGPVVERHPRCTYVDDYEYEQLGLSNGAGPLRNTQVMVYRDPSDGILYHRTPEDFAARMRVEGGRHG